MNMPKTSYKVKMYYQNKWQEVNLQQMSHLLGKDIPTLEKEFSNIPQGTNFQMGKYQMQMTEVKTEKTAEELRIESMRTESRERAKKVLQEKGKLDKLAEMEAKWKQEDETKLKEEMAAGLHQEKLHMEATGRSKEAHLQTSRMFEEEIQKLQAEIAELKSQGEQYRLEKYGTTEELSEEEKAVIEESKKQMQQIEDDNFIKEMVNKAISETLENLGLGGS